MHRKLRSIVEHLSVALLCAPIAKAIEQKAAAVPTPQAAETYGRLPLNFTANLGQADPRVAFLANGSGYSILLNRQDAGFTLREMGPPVNRFGKAHATTTATAEMRVSLPGATSTPVSTGLEQMEAKSNYLIGSDASRWHVGVPNYARVRYAAVYPGVDMVYYGTQRQMEFDFMVRPHADPGRIRLAIDGTVGSKAVHLAVNAAGDLVTASEGGRVLLHKPVVFQTASNGTRQPVEGSFATDGKEVQFRLGTYDHTRELVIDPKLVYATLLGPANSTYDIAYANAMAVDPAGNLYVTGTAFLTTFPVTPGAFQTSPAEPAQTYDSGVNTFVSKMNATGTALLYSTYLNPRNQLQDASQSTSTGITVNAAGEAYITGTAQDYQNKATFPTTPGAFQRSIKLHSTGFVTELTADGSGLVFSTLFGGLTTLPEAIALDSKQNVIIAGQAQDDIVTTSGVVQPTGDPKDVGFAPQGFLTKLNPSGTKLVFSTYLGPPGTYPHALVVDSADNMYVAGDYQVATPDAFPTTPGAYAARPNTSFPGFVMKLNPTASEFVYSTLLLGSQEVDALAVDRAGAAYLTGYSENSDLPATPGAYQTTCEEESVACDSAFVEKLNPTGTALDYATYLGGNPPVDPSDGYPEATTRASGIAVDSAGDAYVVGETSYNNYPVTTDAYLSAVTSSVGAAYLTELNPAGNALRYSTFIGPGGGIGIVLDRSQNAYVAGNVEFGTSFPTTPGAYQRTFPGSGLFLSKFSFTEPFCSFKADLQIDAAGTREEGFALEANIALGSSAPIDAQMEPLTITIGTQSFTIQAGSLVKDAAGYRFSGLVNGVQMSVVLVQVAHGAATTTSVAKVQATCETATYFLFALGRGGSFQTITNPVRVTVSIGDETGNAETTAVILK